MSSYAAEDSHDSQVHYLVGLMSCSYHVIHKLLENAEFHIVYWCILR